MAFVDVCAEKDLKEDQPMVVEVNGASIALFRVKGNVHAIANECAHEGGPLGEGMMDGCIVQCPWHGWTYDVRTGESESKPGSKVARFETKVEDGRILIEA